ncbi:DUF4274 domain-containing protein [Flavobacterium sp. MFBS3-15]|uniref:DUF4274 domain-containing protein n=1 Tax=Flavobacterium sp. MFBS3-15 TaxID=2989816 RepID=UPI0022363A08|nr:DUF4274 domain-containing protein [Flavobacterium sp. MFBS3-15]MCW4468519.1 DUF4274 domain-containing protein [Flavobacterium sp. MFBS3-15]
MNLVERLQKYSGADMKTCEAKLAKRDGKFWEALFDLTMSANDKDILVEKLLITDATAELETILKRLKEIYGGWDFSDVKISVADDDEGFFMANRPIGKEGLHTIIPEPEEMERYGILVASAEDTIVTETLKVLGMIELKHFGSGIIEEIKKIITGKNTNLANEAMGSNCADQPEKAALFLDGLMFNLKPNRSQNHFNAIRAFWSKNLPAYPEITKDVQRLTRSGNSQVRDMASDILVRYGKISPEERAAAELRLRKAQVAGIHEKVEKIKTAKALHAFADKFNWDDDVEHMLAVIRHEQCEAATAKLVYWRSEPNYYQKFTTIGQLEEYHRDMYRLQREIEQEMADGKYPSGKLKYDPKNDHGFDRTKSNIAENEIKKGIPSYMY